MLTGRWFGVLVAFALVVCSSGVRADVVQPPPENCPPGTYGASTHAGQHCAPRPCLAAGTCGTGMTCGVRRLCVVERNYTNMTGSGTVNVVEAACDNGICAHGECVALRVCLPQTDAAPAPTAKEALDAGLPATGGTRPTSEATDDTSNAEPPATPRAKPGCSAGVITTVFAGLGLVLAAVLALWWRRRTRSGARR